MTQAECCEEVFGGLELSVLEADPEDLVGDVSVRALLRHYLGRIEREGGDFSNYTKQFFVLLAVVRATFPPSVADYYEGLFDKIIVNRSNGVYRNILDRHVASA